jgi:signal transduction histidine kinase
MVEDPEQIAADLHDTVVQRLFATAMSLQATVPAIASPQAGARVQAAVDDLDETIRHIRSTIFALQPPTPTGRGVRRQILSLVTESAAGLRLEPHVHLDGPIDPTIKPETAHQLLAVLREALANVMRHANAGRVDLHVGVASGWLTASVTDDGVGTPDAFTPRRRMFDLQQVVGARRGTLEVGAGPGGRGTVVRLRVPLDVGPG